MFKNNNYSSKVKKLTGVFFKISFIVLVINQNPNIEKCFKSTDWHKHKINGKISI